MAGTTGENSFIQFVDLIMLIMTLAVLITLFYFAFDVLKIKTPHSVNDVLRMIGEKAKTLGDVPQKVDIFKLF